LDAADVTGRTPADTFPFEEALSHNSQFLDVLDAQLLSKPGQAALSGYRVARDGHLTTVVDPARIVLPLSAVGLAAD
jgi:hypothetical protein